MMKKMSVADFCRITNIRKRKILKKITSVSDASSVLVDKIVQNQIYPEMVFFMEKDESEYLCNLMQIAPQVTEGIFSQFYTDHIKEVEATVTNDNLFTIATLKKYPSYDFKRMFTNFKNYISFPNHEKSVCLKKLRRYLYNNTDSVLDREEFLTLCEIIPIHERTKEKIIAKYFNVAVECNFTPKKPVLVKKSTLSA
jgi:hypothetical protein